MEPSKANYLAKVQAEFGPNAPTVLKLFPANTEAEMEQSAHDLASAEFITYSTWKWLNMQVETGDAPVYRYHFEQAQPPEPGKPYRGVHHGADIQFVFETLDSENLAWTPNDRTMADMMSSYWVNFAKTGNPNGAGLPKWPRYDHQTDYAGMLLQIGPSAEPHAAPPANRAQFELLDRIANGRRSGEQTH